MPVNSWICNSGQIPTHPTRSQVKIQDLLTLSCKKMTVQNPNLAIFVLLKSSHVFLDARFQRPVAINASLEKLLPYILCGAMWCRSEVNSMYGGNGLGERTVLEPLRALRRGMHTRRSVSGALTGSPKNRRHGQTARWPDFQMLRSAKPCNAELFQLQGTQLRFDGTPRECHGGHFTSFRFAALPLQFESI